MKRLITLLSTLFLVLMSCQQNPIPEMAEFPEDGIVTKSLSTGKVTPDDPIVFLPTTDMKAWTDIGPLEDRFAACEVPAARLESMTTEALVKSMMNYPLNYLVFFYNDPNDAIDLIMEYSPLHQEFLTRQDAAEVYVKFYAAADLDMSLGKSDHDGNYTSLSYINAMFMDYFLGSKLMTGLGKVSVKQVLIDAVVKKLQERIDKTDIFSELSIRPLLYLNESESLGISATVNLYTTRDTQTGVLPRGKFYRWTDYPEASASELNMLTQAATSNYPNAILKGPSTMKYNSHSYAWLETNTTNVKYLSFDQINVFLTSEPLFVSCSDDASAKIVLYTDDEHSAVRIDANTYISKWGFGPLMQHAPTYCPYIQTNKQYFKPHVTYGKRTISGNPAVTINQANIYTVSGNGNGFAYECVVRFMDAPTPTPFEFSEISNNQYRLVCHDYGYFKIDLSGYFNGYCFEVNQFGVTCMP